MKEEKKAGFEVDKKGSDEAFLDLDKGRGDEEWDVNAEQESPFVMKEFLEEAVSLLLTAYLFIIFCIYPFYVKNGYSDIGNEKYQFYKYITMGGLGLILPLALLYVFFRVRDWGKGRGAVADGEGMVGSGDKTGVLRKYRFSLTDWAVAVYGITVVFSYLFSDYKEKGLWGEAGWNMGLMTQLAFVLFYFLLAFFWEYEENLLAAFVAAASGVFLLGVLNRFSIYPIDMGGTDIGFLSTLGNINWYCGYWAVLFPVSFVLYWCTDKLWMRLAALAGTAIGIATGVSQGSSSAVIVFVGLYLCVFCLSFKGVDRMKRFLELVILFCAVCQGLRVWRILRPGGFNFYGGTLSDVITMSRVTLFGMILAGIAYFLLCIAGKRGSADMKKYKALRQIAILVAVVATGVYALLLVLNSKAGGIRFMGNLSALVFNAGWGNARGATWSAAIEVYKNMHGWDKIIGVGPDCFAMHLYTLPDLAERMSNQFSGARLTNAHNEWLTVLVNQGILGLVGYGGIFVSAFVRYLYGGEKGMGGRKRYLFVFGIGAFIYTIHNMVSFQQILSTPFIFLMLGMGEALAKEGREQM